MAKANEQKSGDVLAGLAFGAGVGWLGLWLAQRWLFAPTATAFFGFVIMR